MAASQTLDKSQIRRPVLRKAAVVKEYILSELKAGRLLPGEAIRIQDTPEDGFTGSGHHNVATAVFDVGTKIQVYNTGVSAGVAGWSALIYGKLATQDSTNILAARHFCALDSTSPTPYEFTNEAANYIGAGVSPAVVGLSAMTSLYFGWFWCGGVCPEEFVSALGGDYYTLGDVAIGLATLGQLATPGTTAGEIGLDLVDADTEVIVGYALSADS